MTQTEREAEVKDQFIDYLVNRGYPRHAIAVDQPLSKQHSVTLAIADGDQARNIAYIVIRGSFNYRAMDRYEIDAFDQLRTLDRIARPRFTRVYLVSAAPAPTPVATPGAAGPFFIVCLNPDNTVKQLNNDAFPTYDALRTEVAAQRHAHMERQKERDMEQDPANHAFRSTCISLATVCFFLAFADFVFALRGIDLIDFIRLLLIALACVLCLLPFAGRLRNRDPR